MIKSLILKPRDFFKNLHLFKNINVVIGLMVLAGIVRAFDKAILDNRGDDSELQSVIIFS